MILGSKRVVTYDFLNHKSAEDYAGAHKSEVSIVGSGKVIKVINKFTSHEDSINYDDFLKNENVWKNGDIYNCTSITGKIVPMTYEELGGNQVYIETYFDNKILVMRFAHLDSVIVNVGDIVTPNQVFAYQGNTGLVLSSRSRDNLDYGSHLHLEITENGKFINPRKFATGENVTYYVRQSNDVYTNNKQIQIMVERINIRENPSTNSKDLGDVYLNEVYNILNEVNGTYYNWYKITTNTGITGYVANKKGSEWIRVIEPTIETKIEEISPVKGNDNMDNQIDTNDNINTQNTDYQFLFKCPNEDYYFLKLYEGEELYIKGPS